MVLLLKAEESNLLTVKRKIKNISEAKWARVMNGKYKGDLAEVQYLSLFMFPFQLVVFIGLPKLFMLYGLCPCRLWLSVTLGEKY